MVPVSQKGEERRSGDRNGWGTAEQERGECERSDGCGCRAETAENGGVVVVLSLLQSAAAAAVSPLASLSLSLVSLSSLLFSPAVTHSTAVFLFAPRHQTLASANNRRYRLHYSRQRTDSLRSE